MFLLAVLMSSPIIEEALNLEETIGVVILAGVSRTDVFFAPSFTASTREHVYRAAPENSGGKNCSMRRHFEGM